MVGIQIIHLLEEHLGEPVDGRNGGALAISEGLLNGVIGSKDKSRRVDKDDVTDWNILRFV